MSLTHHLSHPRSPVRAFMKKHFPDTASFCKKWNREIPNEIRIKPPRRDGHNDSYDWPKVGTAFDYMVRYYFPSENRRLMAWPGANNLIRSGWVKPDAVEDFKAGLEKFIAKVQPDKTQLENHDECKLAKHCLILATLEQAYRAPTETLFGLEDHKAVNKALKFLRGPLFPYLFTEEGTQKYDPYDFLKDKDRSGVVMAWNDPDSRGEGEGILTEEHVYDLVNLSRGFYESMHHLFNLPSTLNPTFDGSPDVGGADADLIVDDCLIELKVAKKKKLTRAILWQLLGYVLLDYSGKHNIKNVGVYFARHQHYISWPVQDLIRDLAEDPYSEPPSIEELRSEFQSELFELGQGAA